MTDKDNKKSFDGIFRDFYRVHRTAEGKWGAFLFYQDERRSHIVRNPDPYCFNMLEERRYSDFYDERSLHALTQRFGEASDTLGKVVGHVKALKEIARDCGCGDGRVPRPN